MAESTRSTSPLALMTAAELLAHQQLVALQDPSVREALVQIQLEALRRFHAEQGVKRLTDAQMARRLGVSPKTLRRRYNEHADLLELAGGVQSATAERWPPDLVVAWWHAHPARPPAPPKPPRRTLRRM